MRVTLFDYGAGNLHSLVKALHVDKAELGIERDPCKAVETDILVLPGVGAFSAAAQGLAPGREAMRRALENGLPCLGICLGMQLLFQESEEGPGEGLGLVPGRVTRIRARRVPQMGWNQVDPVPGEPLFTKVPLHTAYYANSYVGRPSSEALVTAWSVHEEDRFAAAVRYKNTVGVQFHPEKSSTVGVQLIHAFLNSAGN